MKPTYFNFTVKDLDTAKTFFEHVFNWRFEKFPMPYDYYRIQTGAEGESGIDGGRVIEPKMAIPGIGWFAACVEPGGLLFGVMEADPDAN